MSGRGKKRKGNDRWGPLIAAWAAHYGHRPVWAESKQEFVALEGALKAVEKAGLGMGELVEAWGMFLADTGVNNYLAENSHRPSLLPKRLDKYLQRILNARRPRMVSCAECGTDWDLNEHRTCPRCRERREAEARASPGAGEETERDVRGLVERAAGGHGSGNSNRRAS